MAQFVYLSNALSGTISRYKLEHDSLIHLGDTDIGYMVMPMTVSRCQQYLYAAIRSEPFRLVQMKIDHQSGDLELIAEVPCEASVVSLATDKQNQWLLAASFNQNRVIVNSLRDSVISQGLQVIQLHSHCHMFCFSPDEQWMLATEFGQDKIHMYPRPLADGSLAEETYQYHFPKGSGPRHMVFSPCGNYLYVLCEMSAVVTTFVFNTINGTLYLLGETEVLPLKQVGLEKGLPPGQRVENDVPRAWAADIHISHDGRFIYVSERTLSVISVLEITEQSPIPAYRYYQSIERQPRSFVITPEGQYLICSGEISDELGLYKIDSQSGKLCKVSSVPCADGAAWVSIVDSCLS